MNVGRAALALLASAFVLALVIIILKRTESLFNIFFLEPPETTQLTILRLTPPPKPCADLESRFMRIGPYSCNTGGLGHCSAHIAYLARFAIRFKLQLIYAGPIDLGHGGGDLIDAFNLSRKVAPNTQHVIYLPDNPENVLFDNIRLANVTFIAHVIGGLSATDCDFGKPSKSACGGLIRPSDFFVAGYKDATACSLAGKLWGGRGIQNVLIHIRRGDVVGQATLNFRSTPHRWYEQTMDVLLTVMSNRAAIRGFSILVNSEGNANGELVNEYGNAIKPKFCSYTSKSCEFNVVAHLEAPMIELMKCTPTVDVFIGSVSGFTSVLQMSVRGISIVPQFWCGVVNNGKVIVVGLQDQGPNGFALPKNVTIEQIAEKLGS
jgi:hypothetical protein